MLIMMEEEVKRKYLTEGQASFALSGEGVVQATYIKILM